jgi:hypothetical protein
MGFRTQNVRKIARRQSIVLILISNKYGVMMWTIFCLKLHLSKTGVCLRFQV